MKILLETLQQFCSTDESRSFLLKPWNRGEYCYATDGRIIVRVARRADCKENPDAPDAEAVMGDVSTGEFAPLPVEPPERWGKPCDVCDGSGFFKKTCDMGHVHNVKCDCEAGRVFCRPGGEPYSRVSIGHCQVNALFLIKINLLPNPVIAPGRTPSDPLRFKFDGGCGNLMGLRIT